MLLLCLALPFKRFQLIFFLFKTATAALSTKNSIFALNFFTFFLVTHMKTRVNGAKWVSRILCVVYNTATMIDEQTCVYIHLWNWNNKKKRIEQFHVFRNLEFSIGFVHMIFVSRSLWIQVWNLNMISFVYGCRRKRIVMMKKRMESSLNFILYWMEL